MQTQGKGGAVSLYEHSDPGGSWLDTCPGLILTCRGYITVVSYGEDALHCWMGILAKDSSYPAVVVDQKKMTFTQSMGHSQGNILVRKNDIAEIGSNKP